MDTKISALTSGAPALATDEIVIARSGANNKLTLAEILQGGFPILTDTIGEATAAASVTFTNDIIRGTITISSGIIQSSAGNSININSGKNLVLAAASTKVLNLITSGAGGITTVTNDVGTITITQDTGWTASTVSTTLKTGLSDLSTPGDVLAYLQALENHLFGIMGILHT